MKVYVDDGRQATSLLRKGMRFSKEEMEFRWDIEAEQEDVEESHEDAIRRVMDPDDDDADSSDRTSD